MAAYESERQAYIAAAIEDVPPEVREENLAKRRDNIEQLFIDAGFDPKAYQQTLNDLDKEAKESQVLMDFNNLESVEEKEAYIQNLRDNPILELGVDETRILRNKLIGELNKAESGRRSVVNTALDRLDGFIDIATAGGEVNQEQVTQIGALAEQYPELQAEFQQKAVQLQDIQAFRSMPPVVLERTINELRSEGITNQFEAQRIELAETTLSKMRAAADRDPISAYIEYGDVDDPAVLKFSSVEEMQQSMQERIDLGNKAAEFFGVERKYLTEEEADKISVELNAMNSLDKAELAIGMNAMPPEIWEQLADKDQGVFAMVSSIGDTAIARRVFEGQDLINDKLVAMPNRSELAEVYNDVAGDVYSGRDREATLAAAKAYYASTATDRNEFNEDEFESAIQAVTGGLADINGMKVQLPREASEEQFDTFVNSFTAEMVDRFGGVQNRDSESAAEQIRELQFKSIGDNRYVVLQSQNASIINKDGEPFTVVWSPELQKIADDESINTRRERRESRQEQDFTSEMQDISEREPGNASQRRRASRDVEQ